jgi:hypothetical protein
MHRLPCDSQDRGKIGNGEPGCFPEALDLGRGRQVPLALQLALLQGPPPPQFLCHSGGSAAVVALVDFSVLHDNRDAPQRCGVLWDHAKRHSAFATVWTFEIRHSLSLLPDQHLDLAERIICHSNYLSTSRSCNFILRTEKSIVN